jgi:thiol:disulfide interchange protein
MGEDVLEGSRAQSALRIAPFLIVALLPIAVRGAGAEPLNSFHVEAELVSENLSVNPGAPFWVAVRLSMDPGWHIYGKNPGDSGLPTTVAWNLPPGYTADPILWPMPKRYIAGSDTTYGYDGEVLLIAKITPPQNLTSGMTASLGAHVSWLACKVECVPGAADLGLALPVSGVKSGFDPRLQPRFDEARAALPVDASRPDAAAVPSAGGSGVTFVLAVVFAFIGGLILNLMPCVLPVLSLKIMGFVREAHSSPRRSLAHGLVFTAGVVVSFWILMGALFGLRAAGNLIGWGFQFQDPRVVAVMAGLLFALGLNLFGVFELGIRAASVGAGLRGRGGLAGSFFTGFLATAVATPCTAPFMGSAIGFALARPAPEAISVFTALALGMAAPSLALSASPRLLSRVPKPGRWMQSLKQALGFLMMGTVVWLASVLAALAGRVALIFLLAALVLIGLGGWIYGRWGGVGKSRGSRVTAAAFAVALGAGAIFVSVFGAESSAPPASSAQAPAPAHTPEYDFWEPYSGARLAELLEAGTPVLIDFGAQWCLTCTVNERAALDNPAVRQRLKELGVTALRADWTDRNEEIEKALASYGRSGVPLYVLYAPGAGAPRFLPELLTPGIVLSALNAAFPAR